LFILNLVLTYLVIRLRSVIDSRLQSTTSAETINE